MVAGVSFEGSLFSALTLGPNLHVQAARAPCANASSVTAP